MRHVARGAALFLFLLLGTIAAAGVDTQRSTETILAELERDPAHKDKAQDLIKRARAAAERANRLRAAGDETHARLADAVAHEWAEAAEDLARAADVEAMAVTARLAAADASALAERERALLEEGIAHNGRLRSQLDEVLREKSEKPSRTANVGADAGAPAPKPSAESRGTPSKTKDGGKSP
jgi:hypothetical protein